MRLIRWMRNDKNEFVVRVTSGSTRDGMYESGRVAKAAYLDDGVIILITTGAVERDDLPRGFQRFLADPEM